MEMTGICELVQHSGRSTGVDPLALCVAAQQHVHHDHESDHVRGGDGDDGHRSHLILSALRSIHSM